jgi:hypothetical protein
MLVDARTVPFDVWKNDVVVSDVHFEARPGIDVCLLIVTFSQLEIVIDPGDARGKVAMPTWVNDHGHNFTLPPSHALSPRPIFHHLYCASSAVSAGRQNVTESRSSCEIISLS